MTGTFKPVTNLRYERKFTLANSEYGWITNQINIHPAFFQKIFHPRQINNIYLDTAALQFYGDNVHGVANRKKVRIRWYGDIFGKIAKPKLEYKIKHNLLGDKWTFDLVPFDFNPGFSAAALQDVFNQSNLPAEIAEDLKLLEPTLLNSYWRSYFLSADQHFRLTLDEQMSYYAFDKPRAFFKFKRSNPGDYIVELKYLPKMDKVANKVARQLRFRLDKSSKYVNGINATRDFF